MVLARLLRAPSPHTQRILVFNFSLLANQKFQNRHGNITQEIPAQGKLSPVPCEARYEAFDGPSRDMRTFLGDINHPIAIA